MIIKQIKYIIGSLLLSAITVLLSTSSYSQTTGNLKQKAELYFSGGEYEMAIPVLNELIEKNGDDINLYHKRGISYLQTQQPAKAIPDLKKVLNQQSNNEDILYQLGSAYDLLNEPLIARTYFRKLHELDQKYAAASYRLAVLYMNMEGMQDSALFFAENALLAKPEDPTSYYTLSMVYLNNSDYKASIEAAQKGLEYDPDNIRLIKTIGFGYYFLENFERSHEWFSRASSLDESHEIMYYRALSGLFMNSDRNELEIQNDGKILLKDISKTETDVMEKMLINKTGKWYYPALRKKFSKYPFEMGIEEFFLLYIGSSGEKNYLQNIPLRDSLYTMFNEGNTLKFEERALDLLSIEPANFPVYMMLSEFYAQKRDFNRYYETLYKYYAFLKAILASGDGSDLSGAYLIVDPDHEYEVLAALGLKMNSRKRIKNKSSCYDLVEAVGSSGDTSIVYFEVHKYCDKIEELMNN